jgi:hypothetical protein
VSKQCGNREVTDASSLSLNLLRLYADKEILSVSRISILCATSRKYGCDYNGHSKSLYRWLLPCSRSKSSPSHENITAAVQVFYSFTEVMARRHEMRSSASLGPNTEVRLERCKWPGSVAYVLAPKPL